MSHPPQVERLWEIALEFRFGIERINVQRRNYMQNYQGYSPELETLNHAVARAEKDIDALMWAIREITGDKSLNLSAPADVERRVRKRLMLLD